MTITLHEKRQTVLRWWMTSVNALTTSSNSEELSTLFNDTRSTWLWSDGVLPPRLNQFQRGYLTGILYSVGLDSPEFYGPQSSACALMDEIFAQARAGKVPDVEAVQATLNSIVDLVDEDEETAYADLGRLLGSMWRAVNLPQNIDAADAAVHALALSVMQMDPQTPVAISDFADAVDCCGSGKRRISIPAVSTAAAFVAAFMAGKLKNRVVVAKSGSAGTTTNNGSADALSVFAYRVRCRWQLIASSRRAIASVSGVASIRCQTSRVFITDSRLRRRC